MVFWVKILYKNSVVAECIWAGGHTEPAVTDSTNVCGE